MFLLHLLLLTLSAVSRSGQEQFQQMVETHVGCFYDDHLDRDLPHRALATTATAAVTVKRCREACADLFYRYAGLQGGGRAAAR